ncbi:MAG: hypothetical protein U5L05_00460 [Rubrivivax sp.]|nr:hypothetical protein [Rubrivivax sp.]
MFDRPQLRAAVLAALARSRAAALVGPRQVGKTTLACTFALIDRADAPARFLLLGSALPALLRQSAESLAGRIDVIEAGGFTLADVDDENQLWARGGFPRATMAASDDDRRTWRQAFIRKLKGRLAVPARPVSVEDMNHTIAQRRRRAGGG